MMNATIEKLFSVWEKASAASLSALKRWLRHIFIDHIPEEPADDLNIRLVLR